MDNPHPTSSSGRTWAVVLAGGEGSRLRALTTIPNGVVVPKQFCSLRGGPSLLTQALIRAGAVAPTSRTCAVVAAQHRWWWETRLRSLPGDNVFVQPDNQGTAHGVLLALLRLQIRDPRAIVVILPADHYIRHEALIARSLTQVAELSARNEETTYLLGTDPDRADTELGYIVPAERTPHRPAQVLSFEEKPDALRIGRLLRAGALWNMFTIAGSLSALLGLYDRLHDPSVVSMRRAFHGRHGSVDYAALKAIYRHLPSVDFSRDVLQPQADRLQVLGVPACGWNDLGTPKRVLETLLQPPDEFRRREAGQWPPAALSFAEQCRLLGSTSDTTRP